MKKNTSEHDNTIRSVFSRMGVGIKAGVVLGYTGLIIVIAKRVSGKTYEILDWGKESYGDGITRKSSELPEILKKILNKYLKGYSRVKIWCTIQSIGVETRFLTIPIVPDRHVTKAVLWAFKKEVESVREDTVFDYDVLGERESQGKKEMEILACSAPVSGLTEIQSLFLKTGWPLAGITVTSFAFQNLFRTGYEGETSKNIATLFIGTDWSRIDIFSNGNLILSRDIKTGTRSLLEALNEKEEQEEIHQENVIVMDRYLDEGDKDSSDETAEKGGPMSPGTIRTSFRIDDFIDIIQEDNSGNAEQIFERILPVIDRLIRQMERTFDHFTTTSRGKRVERLYFTGPLCSYSKLTAYTGEQMGIPVMTIKPIRSGEEKDMDQAGLMSIGEQDEFVPAAGLALSSPAHTLNFIFTFRDKEKRRMNQRITGVLCLIIILVLGLGVTARKVITVKQNHSMESIRVLTRDVDDKERIFGKTEIISLSDAIITHRKRLNSLIKNLYGAAILSEISSLVSEDVKLNTFVYEALPNPDNKGADKKRSLQLKGVVLTPAPAAQKILDQFVERLKKSKLIKQVAVGRTGDALLDGKKVFYFDADLELYE